MTFSGVGNLAASLPEFCYSSTEPLPSKSVGKVGYRPALAAIDRIALASAIEDWKFETAHLSLSADRRENSHFSRIVAFGNGAIPIILEDLVTEPSYLFLALERITGQNPSFPQIYGNIQAIVGAWQQWFVSEHAQQI